MASFQYRVRDRQGQAVTGTLEAENSQLVVEHLRRSGYIITSIKEIKKAKDVSEYFEQFHRVTYKDLAVFSRQFATMIGSGLPLLRTLIVLTEQTNNMKLRLAVDYLRRDVEGGLSLSNAMQKHQNIFPNIFISMVKAGEVSGALDEIMERLALYFENEHDIREKVKVATRYPMIVVVFASMILGFLLTFVIPRFVTMFHNMKAELPLPTKIVIASSQFFQNYLLYILFLTFAIGYFIYRYFQTKEGKLAKDTVLLKLPIFGEILKKVAVARGCKTLGTLLKTGVPILQALEIAQTTVGNEIIAEGLRRAKLNIREGEGIAKPLAETGVFMPMVIQMIVIGEETGSLDIMLNKVSDFYEKEVKYIINNLTAIIEPVMIVFLAVVVGFIIISVVLPMFDIYGQIGK